MAPNAGINPGSRGAGPIQPRSLTAQQPSTGTSISLGPSSGPGGSPVATAIDPSYSTANPFAVAPVNDESDPRQGRYWRDRFGGDVVDGQARGRGIMTS